MFYQCCVLKCTWSSSNVGKNFSKYLQGVCNQYFWYYLCQTTNGGEQTTMENSELGM